MELVRIFTIIQFLFVISTWSFIMFFSVLDRQKYYTNFIFFSWFGIGILIQFTEIINEIESQIFKYFLQAVFSPKLIIFYFILSVIGFVFTYLDSKKRFINKLIKDFNKFRKHTDESEESLEE